MKAILFLIILAKVSLVDVTTIEEDFEYLENRDLSGLDDYTRQMVEVQILELKVRHQAAHDRIERVKKKLENKFSFAMSCCFTSLAFFASFIVYAYKQMRQT